MAPTRFLSGYMEGVRGSAGGFRVGSELKASTTDTVHILRVGFPGVFSRGVK